MKKNPEIVDGGLTTIAFLEYLDIELPFFHSYKNLKASL
jgi:hypothetical protein